MSASGGYGPAAICAGIVSTQLLRVMPPARCSKQIMPARPLPRIRHSRLGRRPEVAGIYAMRPKDAARPDLRKGFPARARLEFDAWLFHPRSANSRLARAFRTQIVLDHCAAR